MSVATIRDDFALLDEWEDRYRYVIELGKTLPPLSPHLRTDANKVRGCVSQVWLATAAEKVAAEPRFHFAGDSDAHIVRGLIAILFALYRNRTARDILKIDAHALFAELGLKDHLTPQRSNGLAAMIERIRSDARTALDL
ncbi:MAG: SufE family protein [Hyphomicrobiaceae bacterium]